MCPIICRRVLVFFFFVKGRLYTFFANKNLEENGQEHDGKGWWWWWNHDLHLVRGQCSDAVVHQVVVGRINAGKLCVPCVLDRLVGGAILAGSAATGCQLLQLILCRCWWWCNLVLVKVQVVHVLVVLVQVLLPRHPLGLDGLRVWMFDLLFNFCRTKHTHTHTNTNAKTKHVRKKEEKRTNRKKRQKLVQTRVNV